MTRLLAPASSLLGRIPLALKFLVVALVLAVPLGVVAYAYVRDQRAQVALSAKERIGLNAMTPLLDLASDAASARHGAVLSGLPAAVPAADVALAAREQRQYGDQLGTSREWRSVAKLLIDAGEARGGWAALAAYGDADSALMKLIVTSVTARTSPSTRISAPSTSWMRSSSG